ncbi:MAG TPA: TonB family protein [Burkholderiaceae bacterium]
MTITARSSIATLLYMLASQAFAEGNWIADANNCKLWNPNPIQNETVTWSGACVDGFADGPGKLVWTVDGKFSSSFEGTYSAGKRNGKGVATSAKGYRYEGDFVDNQWQGKGILVSSDGSRYEGEFADDRRNGKGVQTYKNGARYEGAFADGKLNGKGILTFADGGRYEGDFAGGRRNGKGDMSYADGVRYIGDFADDKRNGKGMQAYKNGTRYEGDFADEKLNGKGVMMFASGDRYEGDFAGGKRTGKGKYLWKSGDSYEGDFVDGKQEGKGTTSFANGDRYEGSFSNNEFNGEGKITYANGTSYDGTWKNGKTDGNGALAYANSTSGNAESQPGKSLAVGDLRDRPPLLKIQTCTPTYSKDALEAKEEGTVRVKLEVGADGKLASTTVLKSSGFDDLDQITIAAFSQCLITPALKDGKPIASTLITEFEWKASSGKVAPITNQLKNNEGVVLIDIFVFGTNDINSASPLPAYPDQEAYQVWLKNLETRKVYGGMFNTVAGASGVGFVIVPEGKYCVESFATPATWSFTPRPELTFDFCEEPSISVKKGYVINAGLWRFARPNDHRSRDIKLIGAENLGNIVYQKAVAQHPELLKN